ncbi:uncharacterized protein L3040_007488 [Drepanopeziza brunnea f. sp. 'multigermtubi']|uniref:Uncharacterized protein n=1 Tax=Marssonina brunnea f. sp. multigermtubi (strain MB_m1) TaxID=1072389 RepID=K1Y048_MARBU|nr:uncharacterized protein MBM_03482 [Drepanopeziza brunnea f. sp. 'multigermtubi' MB_m1]EKD18489.1 hypothetical protein MBM_03482 [Drepanopeziza brunnea f. sp. 'multigermtubi' MB_m1]KAJ5037312.1 hypothetical protein L3040_007488 [Drepanopeziza brunnea f. sp. 'multigermtubi']
MASSSEVKSTALTLRFKYGRQTVFLFTEPLTPFPDILKELLSTLRERYPKGMPTGDPEEFTPIPDSGIDVVLGVPKDLYDLSKGWDGLKILGPGLEETPKSLGLKESTPIAFAFTESEAWQKNKTFHVEFSNVEELYPDEEQT